MGHTLEYLLNFSIDWGGCLRPCVALWFNNKLGGSRPLNCSVKLFEGNRNLRDMYAAPETSTMKYETTR